MRGLKAKTPTDDNVFVEARPEAKTNAEGMDKRVRVLRDEQPTSLIVSTVETRPGVCLWLVAALLCWRGERALAVAGALREGGTKSSIVLLSSNSNNRNE